MIGLPLSIKTGVAAAGLALALGAMGNAHAQAQQPRADFSVSDLVRQLEDDDGGRATKRFTATRPPDGEDRCDWKPMVRGADGRFKNLVVESVAPYADDSAPQVQMSVTFQASSDAIAPAAEGLLKNLALALNTDKLRKARFAIAGHTDVSGGDKVNLPLSCARSIAVVNFLVAQGVAAERLWPYAFGSKRLLPGLAPSSPQHRRVEVRRAP